MAKHQPIDEAEDDYIVSVMVTNYGDMLKVSRARDIMRTLPALRKYVSENPYIRECYLECIKAEQEGQGLEGHSVLNSLINAQMKAFETNESKNNSMYSSEIKKIIQEGVVNTTVDKTVAEDVSDTLESMVQKILRNPLEIDPDKVSTADANEVRAILLNTTDGFAHFSRWAFQIQMGFPFQQQDFHEIIFKACQEIVNGKEGMDRVIITIPPRHSKTQIISIFLPLYSFCYNPGAHNIISSYADDVVSESSGYIRQIMTDPLFQKIFPAVRIDPSKRSLERWGTTRAGVMHAVPTGGKLTGKGAGSLSKVYSGLFCLDDSLKPKDAFSGTVREELNVRFDNTMMSRLANDGVILEEDGTLTKCARTPMVIIMQRLHDSDLVGHILRGGSSDKYTYLNIPGIVTPECGSEAWYNKLCNKQQYTHAIPYLYDLGRGEGESALWPSRKSLESLRAMRESNPYTYNSQYEGDPTALGTGLIQEAWWKEYDEVPLHKVTRAFMTSDTASTTKDYSDYSVICLWYVTSDQELYLVDAIVGKYEVPELKKELIAFWNKHNQLNFACPQALPTALYMEDRSSGQFLNQQFTRDGQVRVMPVPKDKSSGDKVARFLNAVPYFAQGRILFPAKHEHKDHIMREIMSMTGMGSGTGHDDAVDNISDAVAIAFSAQSANYTAWM